MAMRFDRFIVGGIEHPRGKTERMGFTLFEKDRQRLDRLSLKFSFGNKSALIRALLAYADNQDIQDVQDKEVD